MWKHLKRFVLLCCLALFVPSVAIGSDLTQSQQERLNKHLQNVKQLQTQYQTILDEDKAIILKLNDLLTKKESYILDLEQIAKQDKELIMTLDGNLKVVKKSYRKLQAEIQAYRITLASVLIYGIVRAISK